MDDVEARDMGRTDINPDVDLKRSGNLDQLLQIGDVLDHPASPRRAVNVAELSESEFVDVSSLLPDGLSGGPDKHARLIVDVLEPTRVAKIVSNGLEASHQ